MKFEEDSYDLDAIDVDLLRALQADAKTSLSRLGERVGLSAPAVMERVRKLEQAGVITGYHAVVSPRRVGFDIGAFIGVVVKDPLKLPSVEGWISEVPEILESHHVTGGYTLLLKVRTRNTRALEKLISTVRGLEGVEGTETMVVLSTHTERIPLAFDEADGGARKKSRSRKKTP